MKYFGAMLNQVILLYPKVPENNECRMILVNLYALRGIPALLANIGGDFAKSM